MPGFRRPRKGLRGTVRKHKKNLNYVSKILQGNTAGFFWGFREANNITNGVGKVNLVYDVVTGDEMPLHIYPLNNIINDNVTPSGGYKIQADGYDFTSIGSVEKMGAIGLASQFASTSNFNCLYNNYNEIRLMLWGRALRKTVFKVMLCSFQDEDLDMNLTAVTTNGDVQEKRKLVFKGKMLRPMITNPVISETLTHQVKKEYKVLWSKTYNLRETRSTEDQAQHKFVKILRKRNKIIKFQESPDHNAYTNYVDPDEINTVDVTEASSPWPSHTKDNLFLIIMGNSHAEDDNLTYDIQIKSKYTTMGNHA